MKKTNMACPLYGKPECDVLNMQSCKDCPMREESVRVNMQSDVRLYASLMPEGGLAPLFESETCKLCKGETPNVRDGYGILDMGHREPKREVRSGFFRLKKKDPVGFLAPLQFAVCKKCRSRLLFLEYLPLLLTVILTAVAVALVASEPMRERMNGVTPFLPIITVIAAILIGYVLGQLCARGLKKTYQERMYVDPAEHPAVKELQARGWFLLADSKQPRLVFTKKPLQQGLGSSSSAAFTALTREMAAEAAAAAPEQEASEKRD